MVSSIGLPSCHAFHTFFINCNPPSFPPSITSAVLSPYNKCPSRLFKLVLYSHHVSWAVLFVIIPEDDADKSKLNDIRAYNLTLCEPSLLFCQTCLLFCQPCLLFCKTCLLFLPAMSAILPAVSAVLTDCLLFCQTCC